MNSRILTYSFLMVCCTFLAACDLSQTMRQPVTSQLITNELSRQNALTLDDLSEDMTIPAASPINDPTTVTSASAEAYYNSGIVFTNQGFPHLAIHQFTLSIKANPYFTLAYFQRGNVFLIVGDPDQAIRDFDQTILLNPDFIEAYSARGIAYMQKQDWESAISDLDQAIQIGPDSAIAYFTRGMIYASLGESDRAISDFDQAIQLDPGNPHIFLWRGMTYVAIGETNPAISDFISVLGLCGDNVSLCQDALQRLDKLKGK
jgi:tetratricopeptide (TPR) repeat protein